MLALLLASVGIYTIVSLTVAGRRSEIGLRMALGAARGRVVRLVTARVLGTVLIGMLVGGVLAALAAPHVAGAAFGAESATRWRSPWRPLFSRSRSR